MIVATPQEARAVASGAVNLNDDRANDPREAGARSASNGASGADPSGHFRNDIGYADKFVERFGREIRYCSGDKKWLIFDAEHGWQRDATQRIHAFAADFARELFQRATADAASTTPEEAIKLITRVAALGDRRRIEPALVFASSDPSIVVTPDQLDADAYLVGVQNGVVNLRDGSFLPHHPGRLVTRQLAAKYDPAATAPTWQQFLEVVQPDPEMRSFLQRLAGYALTGAIREQVLPFHFGTGANGKGTFLEHALLKLCGSYGAKLTDSLVYLNVTGSVPHLEIADLRGKRFALGEENADGGRLNERLLKSMTGGDRQKGRGHYADFSEYFPTYKIHLVGNHRPRIDGTDDGIWRRFLLVDWPVQIPPEREDRNLSGKLAKEMSGILNWAIVGALEWHTNGLNPPQCCKIATNAYRAQSDKLGDFIGECFSPDETATASKASTYRVYLDWCEREGVHPRFRHSKRALGIQLVNRGWQEGREGHDRQHCWVGHRLHAIEP